MSIEEIKSNYSRTCKKLSTQQFQPKNPSTTYKPMKRIPQPSPPEMDFKPP